MAVNLESSRSIQPYNTYIYIFGDDADHCTGRQAIFESLSVTVTATVKEHIKLSLCNPRRRIGKWRYNVTHPSPRHYMQVSDQLHASAALPWGKESPLPTEQVTG